jgi:hypothetical protein
MRVGRRSVVFRNPRLVESSGPEWIVRHASSPFTATALHFETFPPSHPTSIALYRDSNNCHRFCIPREAVIVLQTFWKRDDLQCVLVRHRSDRFSVQVFIRDAAVVTELCSSLDDATDAADRAAELFGIYGYAKAPPPWR